MPIHPWLAEKFKLIRDIPSFDAAFADPMYAALVMEYLQDPQPWKPPEGVVAETRSVDAPHGAVTIKVFRPTASTGHAPALLWMHGGGFVIGSIDDTESVIPGFELAARARAVVVSVDYRLAVEGVQYPAALDDVSAAWSWLTEHVDELGLDADRLFIGGASVGGNLGVAATVRLRDEAAPMPRGMILGYPLVHFPLPPLTPEFSAELGQLPPMLRFPPEYQAGILFNYAGRIDDLPSGVAPGNFDVSGLPEAWIVVSEYDDLRTSGELFAEQLIAAGSTAHFEIARGMVHGHLGRGPSLVPVDATLDFFAEALR
ncbi:alpha/beta hydrolase fold domain-containing protein [soil metagenome]